MYELLFRLLLGRLAAERAHDLAMSGLRWMARVPGLLRVLRMLLRPDESLALTVMGIRFPSPIGMAAGFDKDATVFEALGALGFGFVEVGTVTARPQPGNPPPRLARLPKDRALVNRMGFNNRGSDAAARRLSRGRRHVVVGGNIGKSRAVDLDDALDDYVHSARLLAPHVDYLAVNVSSPNTPGLRGLQEPERLRALLRAVMDAADSCAGRHVPLAVKVSPDLGDQQIADIADLAVELRLDAIIATNTTTARDGLRSSQREIEQAGDGGLSGPPLARRSLEVLEILRSRAGGDLALISVGGVSTADDVAARLDAGASLVQAYSAVVYGGPLWAWRTSRRLVRLRSAS